MYYLLNKQSFKSTIPDCKNQNTVMLSPAANILPVNFRGRPIRSHSFRIPIRERGLSKLSTAKVAPFQATSVVGNPPDSSKGKMTFLNELMKKNPSRLPLEGEGAKVPEANPFNRAQGTPAKSVDSNPTSPAYLAPQLKNSIAANEQIDEMFSLKELNKLYLNVKMKGERIWATLMSDDRLVTEKLVSATPILQQMVQSEPFELNFRGPYSASIISGYDGEFASSFPGELIRQETKNDSSQSEILASFVASDVNSHPPPHYSLTLQCGTGLDSLWARTPHPESLLRDLTDLESTIQQLRYVISDELWSIQDAGIQANDDRDVPVRLQKLPNFKIRIKITPDNIHFKVEADKPVPSEIHPTGKLEADAQNAGTEDFGLAASSSNESTNSNFLSLRYVVSKLAERLADHLREKVARNEHWQSESASEQLEVEFIAANPPIKPDAYRLTAIKPDAYRLTAIKPDDFRLTASFVEPDVRIDSNENTESVANPEVHVDGDTASEIDTPAVNISSDTIIASDVDVNFASEPDAQANTETDKPEVINTVNRQTSITETTDIAEPDTTVSSVENAERRVESLGTKEAGGDVAGQSFAATSSEAVVHSESRQGSGGSRQIHFVKGDEKSLTVAPAFSAAVDSIAEIEFIEPEANLESTEATSSSGEFRIIIPDNKFSLLPGSFSMYETTLNIPARDDELAPLDDEDYLTGQVFSHISEPVSRAEGSGNPQYFNEENKQANQLETHISGLPVVETIPRAIRTLLAQIPQAISSELQTTVSPDSVGLPEHLAGIKLRVMGNCPKGLYPTFVKFQLIGDDTTQEKIDNIAERLRNLLDDGLLRQTGFNWRRVDVTTQSAPLKEGEPELKNDPFNVQTPDEARRLSSYGDSEIFSGHKSLQEEPMSSTTDAMLQTDVAFFAIDDDINSHESEAQRGGAAMLQEPTERLDEEPWELVMELTSRNEAREPQRKVNRLRSAGEALKRVSAPASGSLSFSENPPAEASILNNTAPVVIESEKTRLTKKHQPTKVLLHPELSWPFISSIVNTLIASIVEHDAGSWEENKNDLLKLPGISREDIASLEFNIKRDAEAINFFITSDKSQGEKQGKTRLTKKRQPTKLASALPQLLEQEVNSALLEAGYTPPSRPQTPPAEDLNQSVASSRQILAALRFEIPQEVPLKSDIFPYPPQGTVFPSYKILLSPMKPQSDGIRTLDLRSDAHTETEVSVKENVPFEGGTEGFEREITLKLFPGEIRNVNIHSQIQHQVSRAETILKNLSGLISSVDWYFSPSKQNIAFTPEQQLAELQAGKAELEQTEQQLTNPPIKPDAYRLTAIKPDAYRLTARMIQSEPDSPKVIYEVNPVRLALLDTTKLSNGVNKLSHGVNYALSEEGYPWPGRRGSKPKIGKGGLQGGVPPKIEMKTSEGIKITQHQMDTPEWPPTGTHIEQQRSEAAAQFEADGFPGSKVESTATNEPEKRTVNSFELGKDFLSPEEVDSATANPVTLNNTQEQSDVIHQEERVDVQNIRNRIRAGILGELTGRFTKKARTRTSNEYREIRLQLSPERLGKVVIRVSQHGIRVSARIFANTPMAKEIIESELSQLRNELTNQGINIEELNVSVGSETSGFQQRSTRNPTPVTLHNRNAQNGEPTTGDSSTQDVYGLNIVNLIA